MADTANGHGDVLGGGVEQGGGDTPDNSTKIESAEKTEPSSGTPSEPQAEPQAEPQTETKTEPQAEPQTETKTEPQAEPQTETKTEPQAEPVSEPPTEPLTEPMSDPSTETPSEPATKEKEPEYEDILGSGALLKKVLKKGDGKKPRMGDRVTVRWSREIPALDQKFPTEELTFIAGDGDVVQALDLIVVLVSEGDVVEVKASHRFMYGEIGLPPDVPPQADFLMTVEILSNKGPVQYDQMDFDARFNEAKQKKERGNFLFKRKEYSLALTSYRSASKIVDPEQGMVYPDEPPEKLQELLEFRAVVLCNTSVSQLRCEAVEAAVKSALEATKLSPSYSKAYFRLGQAYEKKGQIDETIKAYKTALKYDPENSKVLHGELARLTKVNRKAKESEQKMYSKMFWGDKPPTPAKAKSKSSNDGSWFGFGWKAAVVLAGIVGLTSIGLMKYVNH